MKTSKPHAVSSDTARAALKATGHKGKCNCQKPKLTPELLSIIALEQGVKRRVN